VFSDAWRARRLHHRATRLWGKRHQQLAIESQDAAIDLYRRRQPRRPAQVRDLAALVFTRAAFANAQAEIVTAASVYEDLIEYLKSLPAWRTRDEALAEALIALGNCQRLGGEYGAALRSLEQAQGIIRHAKLGSRLTASAWNTLGIVAKDTGRYEHAAHCYAEAAKALDMSDVSQISLQAALQHNLAGLAHAQGRYTDAEAPARRAIALRRRQGSGSPTEIAADETVLAAILAGNGRFDEAETLLRGAIATWTHLFGPEHYEVAVNLHNLAVIEQARGKLEEAEHLLQSVLAIKRRVLGDIHPEIAVVLNNLAALQTEQGHMDIARETYDDAVEMFEATLGPDHPHTVGCRQNLTSSDPPQSGSR
jgi:tetratricopeptide (TPR) repeat protein